MIAAIILLIILATYNENVQHGPVGWRATGWQTMYAIAGIAAVVGGKDRRN